MTRHVGYDAAAVAVGAVLHVVHVNVNAAVVVVVVVAHDDDDTHGETMAAAVDACAMQTAWHTVTPAAVVEKMEVDDQVDTTRHSDAYVPTTATAGLV